MKKTLLLIFTISLLTIFINRISRSPIVPCDNRQRILYQFESENPALLVAPKILRVANQRIQALDPSATVSYLTMLTIEVKFDPCLKKTGEQIRQILIPDGLELRILANPHDHQEIASQAEKETGDQVLDPQGKLLAWWTPVDSRLQNEFPSPEFVSRTIKQNGQTVTQALVVNDTHNVKGKVLKMASESIDEKGKPCIRCEFNRDSAEQIKKLTSENLPDETKQIKLHLGVIMDGKLYMAPAINNTISTDATLQSDFTDDEAAKIADLLYTGGSVSLKQVFPK